MASTSVKAVEVATGRLMASMHWRADLQSGPYIGIHRMPCNTATAKTQKRSATVARMTLLWRLEFSGPYCQIHCKIQEIVVTRISHARMQNNEAVVTITVINTTRKHSA